MVATGDLSDVSAAESGGSLETAGQPASDATTQQASTARIYPRNLIPFSISFQRDECKLILGGEAHEFHTGIGNGVLGPDKASGRRGRENRLSAGAPLIRLLVPAILKH